MRFISFVSFESEAFIAGLRQMFNFIKGLWPLLVHEKINAYFNFFKTRLTFHEKILNNLLERQTV